MRPRRSIEARRSTVYSCAAGAGGLVGSAGIAGAGGGGASPARRRTSSAKNSDMRRDLASGRDGARQQRLEVGAVAAAAQPGGEAAQLRRTDEALVPGDLL